MHAFGLEECGELRARRARSAHAALALNPLDARAHHVHGACVRDDRRAPERRALDDGRTATGWSADTSSRRTAGGIVALFHLAAGQTDRALALYDHRVRAGGSDEVADLIDASALLWRIQLAGGDTGARWAAISPTPGRRTSTTRFCSFNDLHAMLAFVGARDWRARERLERPCGRGAVAADAPWRDHAPARPARLPRPDRPSVAATMPWRSRSWQPAAAGAPPRRQPRAARRAPSHAAARGRADSRHGAGECAQNASGRLSIGFSRAKDGKGGADGQ